MRHTYKACTHKARYKAFTCAACACERRFANSRRRMVQNLDEEAQEHMIQYLYHCNVHAPPSGPKAFAAITGPLAYAKRRKDTLKWEEGMEGFWGIG